MIIPTPRDTPISLKHIAERAGVSKVTVSRALRNNSALSVTTRERIQKLAREMGYVPDPKIAELMSRLRTKIPNTKQSTLGLIWDSQEIEKSTPSYWIQYNNGLNEITGVKARCQELGYNLDLFFLKDYNYDGVKLSRILLNRGIHGIIILNHETAESPLLLDWDRFSIVTIGFTFRSPAVSRIATDHYRTMFDLISHLKELKYQRIGLVLSRTVDDRVENQWRAGYLLHQELYPPQKEKIPHYIPNTLEKEGFLQWYRKYQPDVIVSAGNDNIVWSWMEEMRFKVPDDVGFASFHVKDPTKFGEISGMDHQPKLKARAAVDMLIRKIHSNQRGIPEYPEKLLIPARWVPGNTLKAEPSS